MAKKFWISLIAVALAMLAIGAFTTFFISSPAPECEHVWSESKIVSASPSCEESGVKVYECLVCGETKSEEYFADHDYVEDREDATCEKNGSVVTTCSVCGETHTEILPATGHDFDSSGICGNCGEDDGLWTKNY